jgi:hypothetical protein
MAQVLSLRLHVGTRQPRQDAHGDQPGCNMHQHQHRHVRGGGAGVETGDQREDIWDERDSLDFLCFLLRRAASREYPAGPTPSPDIKCSPYAGVAHAGGSPKGYPGLQAFQVTFFFHESSQM